MIVVALLIVAAVAWTISASRGGNSDTTKPPVSARTQQTLLLQVTDASGQTVAGVTGIPGADINAPQAWDITTGSSNTVIAVGASTQYGASAG